MDVPEKPEGYRDDLEYPFLKGEAGNKRYVSNWDSVDR